MPGKPGQETTTQLIKCLVKGKIAENRVHAMLAKSILQQLNLDFKFFHFMYFWYSTVT
jgi:hypothetical protein